MVLILTLLQGACSASEPEPTPVDPPLGEGEGEPGSPDPGQGEGEGEGPVKPPDPDPPACVDRDLDGFGDHCERGLDCDDTDPRVNPDGLEVCNGIDDDCDVGVDESDPHLGADCDVEAGGCTWPGRFACVDGMRTCQAGSPVTPGLHPHIAPMPVGWALAWLAPGNADPNILQVVTAPLTDDGSLGAAGTRLTRSISLSAGPPVAVAAEGRVEAIYLGSPGRGSLDVHLMRARTDDQEPASIAPLDPTDEFPDAWRPAVAGGAVAWWDGRSDPGGVRFRRVDAEEGDDGVTMAGGAAGWPHLAREGDDWLRMTFIRPPGEVRTMLFDETGGIIRAEHVVATDEAPTRPAQAAGVWVWLGEDGAVRMLNEAAGGDVETVDPFGMPDLDPAAVEVGGRPLIAWTRETFDGPEIVVWSPSTGEGARVLGPGAGPVVAIGEPGVATVFDRGGLVHFAAGACP